MKCPNCNETLLMTERHQVEIDYCPSCRGIWLDRGELDKLMDYASTQGQAPAAPRYDERPRDDHYNRTDRNDYRDHRDSRDSRDYNQRYPKKKKSFLSDFFDFD
ncbi:TFIIB-type zinc ribbon-containing protein [Sphingobacterium paucimobilis]|nr:zf-TFIIB domain-containing protein [Sphingobacterium paucimobilis]